MIPTRSTYKKNVRLPVPFGLDYLAVIILFETNVES